MAAVRSEVGTVVHEVGHFLAAAKFGLPIDFILFNWTPNYSGMHAVYVHDRYRKQVQMNPKLRLALLAAGYAAEMLVFNFGLLNRATSDLEAAAKLLEFDRFELDRNGTDLAKQLKLHDPFGPDDAGIIIEMYNALAMLINAEGGPDNMFVIPNHRLPKRFRYMVPLWRRICSKRASQSAKYARTTCDLLLSGIVRSGG